jgi:hypothetical protein
MNHLTSKNLTINKNGEARKMKHAWHLVDWDQPSSWIADQMGVSQQYVVGRRRKYAPETIRKHHFKTIAAEDRWKGADWSKGNTALGREMGMNRNSVDKARKRHSLQNTKDQERTASHVQVEGGQP